MPKPGKVSPSTNSFNWASGTSSSSGLNFCSHGASSDFGHCVMGMIHRKTWSGVWATTTPSATSGDHGTAPTISGSSSEIAVLHSMFVLSPDCPLSYRYIYVPMGGSQNAFRATLVVFTFVALWHDISWSLLAWGWAVTLFLLPEMIARRIWPAEMASSRHSSLMCRLLILQYSTLARPGTDSFQLWAALVTLSS